ncbi:MAG TPA: transglycosylase domain-containing protein, partial [Pseudonocardiaceae bacterium]|nr:transglycosylase domain-containing protein [Pseudonocardiaceae bacterium]
PVRRPADARREPELLTHRDDDLAMDSTDGEWDDGEWDNGERDDAGDEPVDDRRGRRRSVWRWVRRSIYIMIFLATVTPVVAFFIIYQDVTVPDPRTVALSEAQPVTIYYADGSVLTKLTTGTRIFLKPDAIPINVRHAIEAAEDETFETNNGFDVKAIARSVRNHATGGTGGGSTITQEYVKVATGNDEHTLSRKITEAAQAYKMTKTYPDKNDILAAYLNIVFFGRGAYGIESAARAYYGVDAAHLAPAQAALLAGLVQLPGKAADPEYQHRRFTYVWGRMAANHWITQAQYTAQKFPTPIAQRPSGSKLSWDRQLIVNQVLNELQADGWSEQQLKASGAQIYTTIQPRAQTDAEDAIATTLRTDGKFTNGGPMVVPGIGAVTDDGKPVSAKNPQVKATETAALVSIEPGTGEIVAYFGGNNPKATQLDMANTAHQAGSSFKPYTLTAGVENQPDKIGLDSVYDPSGPQTIDGVVVHNSEGDSCPAPCTVKDAMTNSINTVFYEMGSQVGSPAVRNAAYQAGIPKTEVVSGKRVPSLITLHTTSGQPIVEGGIAIGQYPVRPLDQAQGYATFANGGMYMPAHFVRKVTDIGGQHTLDQFSTPAKPAFDTDPARSAQIAKTVTDSMTQVAQSSGFGLSGGRPSAAKTGTQNYVAPDGTNNNWNSDAWTVGFTPGSVVTAVWFGHYDRPGPLFGSGNNRHAGSNSNYSVFGREEPGAIWQRYTDAYLAGQPVRQFPTTPDDITGGFDFTTGQPIVTTTQQTPDTSTSRTTTTPTTTEVPASTTHHHHGPSPTDTTTPDTPTTTCEPPFGQPNCAVGQGDP